MAVDPRNEYHDIRILCRCAQAVGAGAVAAPCMKVESDSAKGLEYRTVLILQAVEAADQKDSESCRILSCLPDTSFSYSWCSFPK